MFYAHIKMDDKGNKTYQTLKDHCFECANYASQSLVDVGLAEVGYLTGFLHDFGKAKKEWNKYIEDISLGKQVIKGSVNHSFAGVKYILDRYWDETKPLESLTSEIIAYAIGAHHGLFDIENPQKLMEDENGFDHRRNIAIDDIHYEESKENYLNEVMTASEIDEHFKIAIKEVDTVIKKIKNDSSLKKSQFHLILGFLVRNVLSAVIDGDRRSTANFMNAHSDKIDAMSIAKWKEQLTYCEDKLSKFKSDSDINRVRENIS